MKRVIKRLTDKELHRIVKESVDRVVQEAESGGWVVDSSEAEEAYSRRIYGRKHHKQGDNKMSE